MTLYSRFQDSFISLCPYKVQRKQNMYALYTNTHTCHYHFPHSLVDVFLIDSAVTSLSMSPTADFLATSHVDDVGLYLWSNMTLYTHVPLKPLPPDYEPVAMDMPSTRRRPGKPYNVMTISMYDNVLLN